MASIDLGQLYDYILNGGDVNACYYEIHGSEIREVGCLDITHGGLNSLSPEEIGLTMSFGILLALNLFLLAKAFVASRKAYKGLDA